VGRGLRHQQGRGEIDQRLAGHHEEIGAHAGDAERHAVLDGPPRDGRGEHGTDAEGDR